MSAGETGAAGNAGSACAGEGASRSGPDNDSGCGRPDGVDQSTMDQAKESYEKLEKSVKQAKEVVEEAIDQFASDLGDAVEEAVSAFTGDADLGQEIGELTEKAVNALADAMMNGSFDSLAELATRNLATIAVSTAVGVVENVIDSMDIPESVKDLAKSGLNAVTGNFTGAAGHAIDALDAMGVMDAAHLEKSLRELEANAMESLEGTISSVTNPEFADVAVDALKDVVSGESDQAVDRLKDFARSAAEDMAKDYMPDQVREFFDRAS
ncbi:MAG: hypothetical protein CSA52_02460 [Gammaproteobacteria bacterium]|nr:MAG: hypothetical protein CSB48_06445 [Pseudomonadota bacterium]PIE38447.1 MAG: hypothetical protein CSA52_02460 [Gammaproteobacteria bacterium]